MTTPKQKQSLATAEQAFAALKAAVEKTPNKQSLIDSAGLVCIEAIRLVVMAQPGSVISGTAETTRQKFLRLDAERKVKKAEQDKRLAAWRADDLKNKQPPKL